MLPLLTYKIFHRKRNKLRTCCSKHFNESEQIGSLKQQVRGTKNKNIKKPSSLEFIILLIGIFGVPLSYTVYYTVSRAYQWTFNITENITIHAEQYSFNFDSVSLSLRLVIAERLRNRDKYSFNFSWTEIDRRSNLSLEEFHDMYSGKWPVIITDCGSKWPAFKKWNKQFFLDHYAKELVTVKTSSGGVHETFAMPLGLYLSHIEEGYPNQWTYVTDEMFIPSRPGLEADIGSCNELNEDFFKLFQIEVRPWWSFFLWGTRYSRSDLHIDPFNWTGTNMVFSGLKRWKLFPPGQDHLLHVKPDQQYNFPINFYKYNSYVDCFNDDEVRKYPSVNEAKVVEFYQYPGELLIIPSGWFHQAFNEEVTLAVGGQIMNRDNYRFILEELFKGGEVPRVGYLDATASLGPEAQVATVLSMISNKTLERGRQVTLSVYNQLKQLAKSSGLPPPPLFFDLLL